MNIYLFPRTAVKNYHKLVAKTAEIYSFIVLEAHSFVGRVALPLEVLEKNASLPLPASGGHHHCL